MKLIIEDDEGHRTVIPLLRDELAVGRAQDSPVRLTGREVSRRHARLVRRGGRFFLEDLSTFRSVRVNGAPLRGARAVGEGDLIEIGGYDLRLEAAPDEETDPGSREEITAKVGPPVRARGRAARLATFVLALLVASAVAATLWLRSARGAEPALRTGRRPAVAANPIIGPDCDKRASGDPAPPGSR
ncbi:MAG TPA: FHA domain-containing protein [Myxococcales bacterium]|nr:FHA domain-containing protein [Myxococcales bacterium]